MPRSPVATTPMASLQPPTPLPLADDVQSRLRGLRVLVGNTPLLEIACELDGRYRRIFAKAEYLNLTGSIKDRMALHIVRRAYERGALAPGGRIVIVDFQKDAPPDSPGPPPEHRIALPQMVEELASAGWALTTANTELLPFQYVAIFEPQRE